MKITKHIIDHPFVISTGVYPTVFPTPTLVSINCIGIQEWKIREEREFPDPRSGRGQASQEWHKDTRNNIKNLLKEVGIMLYRTIYPIPTR